MHVCVFVCACVIVCVCLCVCVCEWDGGGGETHQIIIAQMCSVNIDWQERPKIKVSVKVSMVLNDKPNTPITSNIEYT